jgi:hypothetical protein
MSNDNTRYTITINADELHTLREGMSLALDELIEYEKGIRKDDVHARRRIAREIDATTALIAKFREQAKRGDIATETRIAPAHWAPALLNGDYTGLSDDDARAASAFDDNLPGPVMDVEHVGIMHGRVTDTPEQRDGDYAAYTCAIDD